MFEHYTNAAIAVIMQAQEEARRLGHNFVGSEQLLLGIVKEGSSIAARVLSDFGVNLANSRAEVESIIGRGSGNGPTAIPFTPKVKQVFEQAFQEARMLDYPYIELEYLLLSLTQNVESVAYRVLNNLGVDPTQVRTQLIRTIGEVSAVPAGGRSRETDKPRQGGKRSGVLAEFSTDLTELAASGKLDPVIGRAQEIERVVQILGRRTKNNPVLVGEPGVGKTAIAEGLAQRIINQDVPEALFERRVISLDLAMLVSGTRFRGDFEERLNQVMAEVREAQDIILVIDEIHTLVGAGSLEGSMDAANLLKPALARGELQCIGATTLDEYRKYIEKDAALERRFQRVTIAPPSVDDTLQILSGLRGRYEQFHRLTITDAALEAAATLSARYINDRHLPDKAIDLIDEAGSRVRLRYSQKILAGDKRTELRKVQTEIMERLESQSFKDIGALRTQEQGLLAELLPNGTPHPEVTDEDIADIVASWTGVPVSRLTESESAMILHLEDTLHERVVGQNEAVEAVSKAVRRSRVGMRNPNRPIASLIFSGPTGVGKSELAKALAAAVFGAEDAMIRIDMSEFMEPQSVSKLIGSPPGYVGYDEGGQLTEAVRRKPYTVILLDEIEKAHPDVFNILLQLLDDGHLSDAKGRKVSFKNTLIIMTSNIGSKVIEKGGGGLGFELSLDDEMTSRYNNIRNLVNEEMKQFFRPELLNRIDEIIVFRQLIKKEVAEIAEILLTQVTSRLAERNITFELTDAFKEHLVNEGYDQTYGARPMRRAISRLVEDYLAEALLSGAITDGDTAIFDLDDDAQVIVRSAKQPALVGVSS
ncbi:MAG: ATP-dependent Clp protease ATP-binding subunit [Leptolyngbyaceae cyanobacterium]